MLEFQRSAVDGGELAHWLTGVEVHEEGDDLVFRAELPGLTMRQVEVSVDHGDLLIDGDGWDESVQGHEHYEHVHGRLPLPFLPEPGRVAARFEHEILELRIPVPRIWEAAEWPTLDELSLG